MAKNSLYAAFERMWQHIIFKIDTATQSIKDDLLNGAGEAYDTLKELGDLIDSNHSAIDALQQVATGKQEKLTGTSEQIIGFDINGNAIAKDAATKAVNDAQGNNIANTYQTKITGQEGQVVVINAQGQPVAQDVSLEPICIFDIDEDGALFSTSSLPTLPTAEEGEF